VSPVAPTEAAPVVGDPALDALDGVPGLPLGPDATAPAPEPGRGRLRRLWFVPAGVALLGAAALVPSVGGGGPGAGEARVLVDGVAVVTDADGGTTTVRDDRIDVGPGDEVAVREGRAVFEMAGDVQLEGLGAHGGRDGTTVEMAVAPKLVTGRLLAVAPAPIEVEAGEAAVTIGPADSADGIAHLDRRLGLGVETYRGEVAVESAGRQEDVARYRRADVAAPGALGPDGLPLRYEADDAWDRRYLGEALTIDAQIVPLLAALGTERGDVFLDPAALREAVPGLPAGGDLADRLATVDDGGTALVLAAIATAVDDRSVTAAWDRAAGFQGDGALWGLTALDQGARSGDVLPVLRAALDTLDLEAPTAAAAEAEADTAAGPDADAAGPASTDPAAQAPVAGAQGGAPAEGTPPAGSTPDGTTPPPAGGGGGGGPSVPGVTVPPPPNVPVPPVTVPPVPDLPAVVGGVGGTVGEVVDGATDVVDGVLPGVGAGVDDTLDGVGGLIGALGSGLAATGTAAGDRVVGPLLTEVGETVEALGTGLSTALGPPPEG
jgi:hypothetical protein